MQASTIRKRRWLALMTTILCLGVLLSYWMVRRADRAMREDMLQQAGLIVQAMDLPSIQAVLSFHDDVKNPKYVRLKQQFAVVHAAGDNYRSIYIIDRKNVGIRFFLLDNGSAGFDEEVPADNGYGETSEWMSSVAKSGRAETAGPFQDRSGSFMTALVPIVDPKANVVVAVLGVDFDASDRRWNLLLPAIPSVLLTLAMIAILCVGMALLVRRARQVGVVQRWMAHLEAMLVVAAGLVLTLFVAWTAHRDERHNRCRAFTQLAAGPTLAISDMLRDLSGFEMEGLARFYEGSEEVTYDEFFHYTGYLTKNPVIQAWAWIPVVPAAERIHFEKTAREAGLDGFEFWQQGEHGDPVPVASREVYYPVFQMAPMAGNTHALGFDLGSEPQYRVALEEAARTGLMTCSDPSMLVPESDNHKDLLVFRPVFVDDRSKSLRGFVLAVLRLERLLEIACPSPAFMHLEFAFLTPDSGIKPMASKGDADQLRSPIFQITRPILALGRVFAVTAYADNSFLRMYPARAGWLAALSGVALTTATAIVLGMILQRRAVLEQLVDERTSQLRDSEALLGIAGRTARFGGWSIDLVERKIIWSDEVAIIHGKSPGYAPSLDEAVNFYAPEWRDRIDRVFAACAGDGTPYDEEIEIITTQGRRLWVHTTGEAVRDRSGTIVRVQGAYQDITDRKQAEAKHRSLEEQLFQAQKLDAIGRMSAQVAHDFANFLTVIRIYAESALQLVSKTHEAGQALVGILQSVKEASAISKSLLTFSRGGLASEKKRLDLVGLLKELQPLIRHGLPSKVTMYLETCAEGSCYAMVDRTQLSQILINLAINARDAMPDGGTLSIGVVLDNSKESRFARLTVKDTGQGMSPEVKARLFEPFFSTKPRGQGAGLGLAIVHGIVTNHHGRIEVESEIGAGTTFTILLPIAEPDKQGGDRKAGCTLPRGHGELILLGHGDVYVQRIISSLLAASGYEVILAEDGGEVLALFARRHADVRLLVLSAALPIRPVEECVMAVRSDNPRMPVIILAGGSHPDIQHNDTTVVLAGPLSMSTLLATAAGLLANHQAQTEAN